MSDLQSEALPALLYLQQKCIVVYKSHKLKKVRWFILNNGRGQGIRTLGGFHLAGFQNRYDRPTLSTLYIIMVRMIGIEPILRNRNWILSPTRLPIPPHSQYTLGKQLMYYLLKLDGNYNRFFFICQEFFEKYLKFINNLLFN